MRRHPDPRVWVLLLGAVLAPHLPGRAQGRTVTVFAAASLTDALTAAQAEWEEANPGVKLRISFGASSQLRTQIEQGAPADLFAAADRETMGPLAQARRVAAPRIFATNRLTIAVPRANPGRLSSPRDLARPGLRLVTTAETVPIGRYTQEALAKLATLPGYGTGFPARVNANVVSRETNVRGVLAKVELGEADAALVYQTDVRASQKVRGIDLPREAEVRAEYPIAVVTAAREKAGAEGFARFLLSRQGRAVLRRFGFGPP